MINHTSQKHLFMESNNTYQMNIFKDTSFYSPFPPIQPPPQHWRVGYYKCTDDTKIEIDFYM